MQEINKIVNIGSNMYNIEYFSEAVRREIATLPLTIRARYAGYVERMKLYGPNLGMPHTRAMGAGLFELRLIGAEGIGRVFYCTLVEGRIVILHSFIKKTQETPARELATARQRMKEIRHET